MKFSARLRDVMLIRGHTFLSSCLSSNSVVIDAGSHLGEFAHKVSEQFNCKVIALEPNGTLPAPTSNGRVVKLPVALSNFNGSSLFNLTRNPEAGHVANNNITNADGLGSIEVEVLTLNALLERLAISHVDLLKLDIEGAEFEVISSFDPLIATKVRQISVEFHPSIPTPSERDRIDTACRHLASLNFKFYRSSYRGFGDVLFLNERYFKSPNWFFSRTLPFARKTKEFLQE